MKKLHYVQSKNNHREIKYSMQSFWYKKEIVIFKQKIVEYATINGIDFIHSFERIDHRILEKKPPTIWYWISTAAATIKLTC